MLYTFFHILNMKIYMRHLLLLLQCRRPNRRQIIIHLLNGNPSWNPLLL